MGYSGTRKVHNENLMSRDIFPLLRANTGWEVTRNVNDSFSPRFRSITKQYFRKADGVVLLYDLSSEASFVNIKSWMTSVEVRTDACLLHENELRRTQLDQIQSKAF